MMIGRNDAARQAEANLYGARQEASVEMVRRKQLKNSSKEKKRLGMARHTELFDKTAYRASTSASHRALTASLGMRQSPRGDRLMVPTLGPSGRQERLNCWVKKRR